MMYVVVIEVRRGSPAVLGLFRDPEGVVAAQDLFRRTIRTGWPGAEDSDPGFEAALDDGYFDADGNDDDCVAILHCGLNA